MRRRVWRSLGFRRTTDNMNIILLVCLRANCTIMVHTSMKCQYRPTSLLSKLKFRSYEGPYYHARASNAHAVCAIQTHQVTIEKIRCIRAKCAMPSRKLRDHCSTRRTRQRSTRGLFFEILMVLISLNLASPGKCARIE